MNRKRWIYVGTLGIATIAFIVDRMFLGEPQTVQAKEVLTNPKPAQPAPAQSRRPQAWPAVVDPSLAWLEKLDDAGPARNVFAPSPELLGNTQQKPEATATLDRAKGPQPGSPEAFEAAHKLQATTVMVSGGLAVVDGQCLNVGETLDGFRLARVEAGRVEFRRGGERVILTLPMPPAPSIKGPHTAGASPGGPKPTSTPNDRPGSGWGLLRRLWR